MAGSMRATLQPPMPRPDAAVWCHAVESFDVDEFAAAQADWSLQYEQLSAGRFAGHLHHVQLPGLRLVHEQATCATRQRGMLGSGHVGMAMGLDLAGHAAFSGQSLRADSIMIGPTEHLDLCVPAGYGLIGAVVDVGLLGSVWQQLYHKPLSAWTEQQVVVQARPVPADGLRQRHLAALAEVAARPALLHEPQAVLQLRDAVLLEWIEAIPEQVSTDDLGTAMARKRVVDRACELMLARPDEPPTVLQICRHIGTSPRKLDYCFRSVLGTSPARYLRTVRLGGVRRELSRGACTSVQDVAARWGFWHLGEFAAVYRRQFDELPSQTLRRSQAA